MTETTARASSAMHLYDTDDAFRDTFNEAVDRIRAMAVTYITVRMTRTPAPRRP